MIKVITKRWLENHGACQDSLDEFDKHRNHNVISTLKRLIKKGEYEWSGWLFDKILSKKLREQWKNDCNYISWRQADIKYTKILEEMYKRNEELHIGCSKLLTQKEVKKLKKKIKT